MMAAEDHTMRRERERLAMPFSEIGTVPEWIEEDIDVATIEAILGSGGLDSGCYMPAVDHRDALATMSQHGDAVLRYVEDQLGELPAPPEGMPALWSALAVFYLSTAIELWCQEVKADLPEPYPD